MSNSLNWNIDNFFGAIGSYFSKFLTTGTQDVMLVCHGEGTGFERSLILEKKVKLDSGEIQVIAVCRVSMLDFDIVVSITADGDQSCVVFSPKCDAETIARFMLSRVEIFRPTSSLPPLKGVKMSKRRCTNCRHGCQHDVGYSDYTVEGTVFICLKGCNPGMQNRGVSFESFESNDKPPFDFAETCTEYRSGKPQERSVEDPWD